MKLHEGLENFEKLGHAVVTSGTFDGVHLGHRKILKSLTNIAKEEGGQSVIITFFPHPRTVIFNDSHGLKQLSTMDEKIELLESFGVDHLVVIPFTREFSEIDSLSFIKNIIIDTIGAKTLVIGYDHRFGKNREGTFEFLKQNAESLQLNVIEIPRVDIDTTVTNSTAIRNALNTSNIPEANRLLGRQYSLQGKVVKGKQLGRTIGFPTANILVQENYKLIPPDGVYAAKAIYNNNENNAVVNIGVRPTVEGGMRTIEAHLLDFDQDIYGENLKINFVAKLRNEQKFDGLESLKSQIYKDIDSAMSLLG